ncbi:hypothetical protein SAMN06269117_11357 [Balnearium lithotrophicum]|uniref:Uncharacterized protein n=1 Tax=Balnearium lithotrophicum TaxID=223788 RepID=A0A521CK05_9BACT|nr:hypothetical protein [Balnearium lithotrophicum]SMO59768.1 hypothetical protein SAMN06269117_11357 [Balnearium lithotrophicum]
MFRILFDIEGKGQYNFYGGIITLGEEKKILEYLTNKRYRKLYKYLVNQVKEILNKEADQFGNVGIFTKCGKKDFFDVTKIKKITVNALFRIENTNYVRFDLAKNKKISAVSEIVIPVIRFS